MANAISAAAFLGTLGINTHIDFDAYGYQNLTNVENDINYLGVKIIRDSSASPTDAQTWLAVAQATGAKFDDFVGEASPAGMQTDLSYVPQLAQEGILASIEGGDEEDDAYAASVGNNLQDAAQFQRQVYAMGQQLGLPVINMSFGAGWTAANNWQGDYGAVGNLAAYATYANAHTYPNVGQTPNNAIQQINTLAELAATGQPIITTEIGWNTSTVDATAIAKYVLDATMDGIVDGDHGMYFYALFDDMSGNWGLFNSDGTPRPAATALHDLTALLADTGANAATFTPGSLNYTLSGTQTGDSSVLIEKSNGSFWLSLWNESEAANSPHTITVNIGAQAASVVEFDPLTGTSSIQTWSNVSSVQVSVPDHPVLLEIVPTASAGPVTPAPAPDPPAPTPMPASAPAPTGPAITVPSSESVTDGSITKVSGVSIADASAASNPGTMALDLSDTTGLLTMTDADGVAVAGSGTHAISVTGTLAQLNADLATLSYTAGSFAGSDAISVNVVDQAGLQSTKSIGVAVTLSPPAITVPSSESVTGGSTTKVSGVCITDPFGAANPGTMALNLSDTTGLLTMTGASGAAVAGSGTHAISISGTLAQLNADLATLSYTAGSVAGSDAISVNAWNQAGLQSTKSIGVTVTLSPPAITVPSSESVTGGSTTKVSGVCITDPFGAANPGTMALNLSDTTGLLTMTGASGAAVAGSGTHAISISGTLAQLNADLATLSYTAGGSAGSDAISVNVWNQAGLQSTESIGVTVTPSPPAITVPSSESVTDGATTKISGVSITDPFGATGTMALNLSDTTGLLTMTGANGVAVAGSGTHAISVTGTLAQINADLATLSYTAGSFAGSDAISVNAVDQAGLQSTRSIGVTVTLSPPAITVPSSESVTDGSTTKVSGVCITDPFGAANSGTMALNLSDTTGLLTMTGANGAAVAGSGTHAISISGTLAQLDADLATLSYTAGSFAGSDAISVNAWNQAGLQSTRSIGVTVTLSPPAITVPSSESVTGGSTTKVSGVCITDPFGAANPGTMALNLSDTTGLLTMTGASGAAVAGSGTHAISISGTLAQLNADLATLSYTAGSVAGSDAISVNAWNQAGLQSTKSIPVTVAAAPPAITLPVAKSLAAGATAAISGVSVSDAAAGSTGTIVLNLSAGDGTLSMTNASGTAIAGSGTHAISVSGTVAQIDADLAHLSYTAGSAGSDNIVVDVWDGAGHEASRSLPLTVTGTAPATATTSVINVASATTSDTVSASNVAIYATAGNHAFLITGSNDVLTATGGNETVTATGQHDTITTGAGNDTMTLDGSGAMVNAGGGQNTIADNGSGNQFILPAAGQGYDTISGAVLTNGDLLDFRPLLAATSWNGQTPVGSYLQVSTVNGSNTVISVSATGAGGSSVAVATLDGTGAVSLSGLLAHAIL